MPLAAGGRKRSTTLSPPPAVDRSMIDRSRGRACSAEYEIDRRRIRITVYARAVAYPRKGMARWSNLPASSFFKSTTFVLDELLVSICAHDYGSHVSNLRDCSDELLFFPS